MKISKEHLLDMGIKKLKSFGFVNVNSTNVLEDEVYRYYLKEFLLNLPDRSEAIDKYIMELFHGLDHTTNG